MKQSQIYILSSSFKKAQMVLGFLLLACGCSIYMIFRNQDIVLNKWCQSLGIADFVEPMRMAVKDSHVPDFILYSLPDGLYCASYILLMDAAWEGKRLSRNIAVALIPSVAIMHEIAQGIGWARGTFDICDLIFYALPFALYFTWHKSAVKKE